MNNSIKQQIIISGVGGQGVLFVTRLLAEAAIQKGYPVFTSETHGMAQRGGTVVSHLKVGDFSSPLIRPPQADGLLALKAENVSQYGDYLKPGGWAVVNSHEDIQGEIKQSAFAADADTLAQKLGNPKAINLVLLGVALSKASDLAENKKNLFCSFEDIRAVLENRLQDKKEMLSASLKAMETGYTN
ncbi:indolepyruvate oxidoreductase subunit beta [Desulfonema magnum]|uniref:Oxidoreductase family protein n=1 Tax=Desulfonema magnum TaxID=45655 RepID=A0A975BH79_9BACT|nr:indolepyruvate oxidoreductase subunit beta [Desulfonema magnum]QTA84985.1 Oxidoreductase family protein [Desulfonema magnum]